MPEKFENQCAQCEEKNNSKLGNPTHLCIVLDGLFQLTAAAAAKVKQKKVNSVILVLCHIARHM